MVGIYFSGTGNTKYCLSKFLKEYDESIEMHSIEENNVAEIIKNNDKIIFAYPIQFSSLPKIVRDFIVSNNTLWSKKKIFIIATMGLFSGDGSGVSARLFKKYNAEVIGGLHLKMPDSICDEKALKRSKENNQKIIRVSEEKIKRSVRLLKNNKPHKEGLGILYHFAGLFGQRLYFYNKTKHYTDKLKIDQNKCIGCGKCFEICPMKNIEMKNGKAFSNDKCTMCYRCANNCPKQAITLLGKKVVEQCRIEKYISRE